MFNESPKPFCMPFHARQSTSFLLPPWYIHRVSRVQCHLRLKPRIVASNSLVLASLTRRLVFEISLPRECGSLRSILRIFSSSGRRANDLPRRISSVAGLIPVRGSCNYFVHFPRVFSIWKITSIFAQFLNVKFKCKV